jgi:7-carboxy-7-deazaguanine synthase
MKSNSVSDWMMSTPGYPLMEHFYTIQGEGANTGTSAYFLRLGGCDVGCVWCDVKASWNADQHAQVSVDDMVSFVLSSGAQRVVVTGGEPCQYNLTALSHALQSAGIKCYLETSGAYPITGSWDWVCVSPKKFKSPLAESLQAADELKVVVFNRHDFDWAETNAAGTAEKCRLFLQPEFSVFARVTPLIVDFVKQHPRWSISLQTHKFMDIP